MNIKGYLEERKSIIDRALDQLLPHEYELPSSIHQAMRYSIFAGGKRLRPILATASCEVVGGNMEHVLPTACALECIHTYSLIHDDLPCMDDDDLRRGIPTCHRTFGEAVALLAGDALLTHAFYLLAMNNELCQVEPQNVIKIIAEISKACSSKGLIGGQIVDLASEDKEIDLPTLEYIHKNKTGALIKVAIRSGALIGNANKQELDALTTYGQLIGLAFQITDDILDIEGDVDHLGKTPGKSHKATYPAILGLKQSKKLAGSYIEQSIKSIQLFGDKGKVLKDIAQYVLNRDM